ncbi:bifunctional [glutamine synthetase] adenylyltransferase/[glutamine synthetase]-adenylyl-L-tyrosine phosphorylase [Corynebacterium breve]|uniref:Bifunctional glutamine synthetase adenylyltransferase/adenylyl-removing enzyme n=1 Tax=Corynebacterium breve TaxID=3049799 RepID=A0ABY8VEH3_9CORY|nr:bifunctional [glutamine synthetase] adenylyltransferase/[glutamine synthetase]-adenylyl-L-tyrosine phosphorylase [Corynebacterium breve]WIM67028.1 bifunctional [glutamine synthetase] adenylyltransferase/[glutamine synthetase]-adenylyl-L-tyrosine phosphorylase [Corynebacterium breve]
MAAAPRSTLPSPAALGLTGANATEDLEVLGWDDPAIRWTLAGSGDPDLALNTARRVMENLGAGYSELREALLNDDTVRVRFMALIGGSTALGDHLAAHPELWREFGKPRPSRGEIFHHMLSAVSAAPEPWCVGTPELDREGTYRAAITGTEAKKALRFAYRTLMMRIGAADLAGTFAARKGHGGEHKELDYTTVTGLLTDAADAALTAALAVAVRGVYGDDEVDSQLAIIAMGKCGAQELNYISDVDVIFVAEPATPKATRLASEFNRIGSSCFFEVDANLRPEGKSGALVRTLDSHIAYYKRWAETWEFQALLKARPMTGHIPLGQKYKDAVDPMVWEASQRESFVDDIQAMRRRVLENVPGDMRERELKLGSGGLRDVEFAVQLLQLVHGRIDESLRVLNTIKALEALSGGGYIGREDTKSLIAAYEFLRLLEHRLQLHRFRRTHTLPAIDDTHNRKWLAATAGFAATTKRTATKELEQHLKKVRRIVSDLHAKLFYRPLLNTVVTMSVGEASLSPEAAKLQLAALGYLHPDRAFEHLTALAKGASRKSKLQAILLPTLMEWLAETADPDAGLLNYRKLSDAAFDRTWFLRMLRDEGIVGQRLMHILGTSPYTADLIIRAPDVVKMLGDGAKGPKLLDTAPDQVFKALVASSKRHQDPDKAVNVARALRRTELARIAAADLLDFMDVRQVCEELTWVWDAVLEAALRAEIRADLLAHDYDEPLARIAVIGMGRLGGKELGYGSDADVMIVAEPVDGVDEHDALTWATRIIDQMRRRLSKPSGDPPLEVDLGLRPEGRSGAVVRTINSYERYYSEWGEVWEKQALQRATLVAGDADVGEQFLLMIDQFRYPKAGATAADIREIRRIKARVDNERLPRGADKNTHTKLGRGALSDIEWTVQLLTMMHAHEHPELHNTSTLEVLDFLASDKANNIIEPLQVRTLQEAWLMATNARNALVLVRGKRTDQLPTPGPLLAQVAGAAGFDPHHNQDFLEEYLRLTRRSYAVVEEVFWGEAPTHEFAE